MIEPQPSPDTPSRTSTWVAQVLAGLIGGGIIFMIVVGLLILTFEYQYSGRIYPGISVAGIDLSGMEVNAATDLLATRLNYPITGRIAFQDGNSFWQASPLELGLFIDAETSAKRAYDIGRQGNPLQRLSEQFNAWYSHVDLPMYLIYNERAAMRYLESIAAEVDLPVIEANLGLQGIEVDVRSGQIGRKLDIQSTLANLNPQFITLTDGLIPVTVEETPPVILDVEEQAAIARNILSAPLKIYIEDPLEGDPGPWTFDPQILAKMLTIERVASEGGDVFQVGLEPSDLRDFLESLADDLSIEPVDARMIFNDDTRELEVIQPAIIGRGLDVEETLATIRSSLAKGGHEIAVKFEEREPLVTDDLTAAEAGITELVSSQTSYFFGSSASRIQNIETASSRFHGVMIAPGQTFSMADALGDISLDSGYAEAWIIYGDRTIKGVGGGVCQVSTTLFRNVFFGGFPVAERHSHAYRVYYYELTSSNWQDSSLAGLDATVYVPLVDFKFTNDTPYWLLMETYVNAAARSLTWKFYSTSDGREVEWHTTGLRNRVDPPEPLYTENPSLSEGEIKQVDWAVEGADVTVTRTVYRNGEAYLEDAFHTHYVPWRAVYEYGPGTEGIPTPEPEDEELTADPVG